MKFDIYKPLKLYLTGPVILFSMCFLCTLVLWGGGKNYELQSKDKEAKLRCGVTEFVLTYTSYRFGSLFVFSCCVKWQKYFLTLWSKGKTLVISLWKTNGTCSSPSYLFYSYILETLIIIMGILTEDYIGPITDLI